MTRRSSFLHWINYHSLCRLLTILNCFFSAIPFFDQPLHVNWRPNKNATHSIRLFTNILISFLLIANRLCNSPFWAHKLWRGLECKRTLVLRSNGERTAVTADWATQITSRAMLPSFHHLNLIKRTVREWDPWFGWFASYADGQRTVDTGVLGQGYRKRWWL